MRSRPRVHPEIEEHAGKVLTRSGPPRLANGYGVDVEAIIQEFCEIEIASIPDLKLGGRSVLAAYVPDLKIILVEHVCNESRKRFSLAHELGHAQLEDSYGKADPLFPLEPQGAFFCDAGDAKVPFDERRSGRRHRAEVRANQFAAAVLMPEGLVREAWRESRDEGRCADLLGVSPEALGYRLSALGMGLKDQR